MHIQSSSNVNFQSSFYDKFFRKIPNKDIKNPAAFNKIGQRLASPHWNRLAIGVAAISSQPALDYYNPRVDRDTAKASMYRTIGKILACTGVGFAVRGACYKITEKYANACEKEGSTLLTPKEILKEKNMEIRRAKLKIHKNAYSTVFALAMMVGVTNWLFDAPLTTKISNFLIKSDKSLQKNSLKEAK